MNSFITELVMFCFFYVGFYCLFEQRKPILGHLFQTERQCVKAIFFYYL